MNDGLCPNCGRWKCHCTWTERLRAIEILRRRDAEERRKRGERTAIERGAARYHPQTGEFEWIDRAETGATE